MKPAQTHILSEVIASQWRAGVKVADGGWSTQLEARGGPPSAATELLNLTHPPLVAALAREYVAAGATILTTNTFAANKIAFERRGIPAQAANVAEAGARLARQIAGQAALVAGVIGPSTTIVAMREVDEAALIDSFGEAAAALRRGGADLIVLETFSELAEVLLALRSAKAAGLPVAACLSFDSGPQRTRTHMGLTAEQAARELEDAGADLIGCNCGAGIATALPALVSLRANCGRPIWVKPSAGLPDLVDGLPRYSISVDDFAAPVPQLLEAGANVIGGCCGVGPEHIRRIAAIAASWGKKQGKATPKTG